MLIKIIRPIISHESSRLTTLCFVDSSLHLINRDFIFIVLGLFFSIIIVIGTVLGGLGVVGVYSQHKLLDSD